MLKENFQKFLTYAEVENLTKLKRGTLYSMVSKNQIPHHRFGNRFVRFNEDELKKWLDSHHVEVRTTDSKKEA